MKALIHHELIGSVPNMEFYRNSIPNRIAKWEASRAIVKAKGLGESLEHMTDGVLLELIAQHFFGLDSQDYGSVPELVEVMRELEPT